MYQKNQSFQWSTQPAAAAAIAENQKPPSIIKITRKTTFPFHRFVARWQPKYHFPNVFLHFMWKMLTRHFYWQRFNTEKLHHRACDGNGYSKPLVVVSLCETTTFFNFSFIIVHLAGTQFAHLTTVYNNCRLKCDTRRRRSRRTHFYQQILRGRRKWTWIEVSWVPIYMPSQPIDIKFADA